MFRQKFNHIFFPHDTKSSHFKSLDGLRGIAVLLVLLSHISNENMFFHEALNFKLIGKVGVYLFFVLSAYLLDRQIALAFITKKNTKAYWKNYFLRRFLRIFPLFLVALILHGLFTFIGIKTVIDRFIDVPAHLLLLQGESIFWSIPVEFKYYLLSPLMIWICHKYLNWNKIYVFWFFLFLMITTFTIEIMFDLPLISTFKYLPIFLVGTMISIYEILYRVDTRVISTNRVLNLSGIIALIIIFITIPYYFERIFRIKVNFQASEFFLPFGVLWGAVMFSSKYTNGFLRKILELKFLRFLGSISFSVYLLHMLFLHLVSYFVIPKSLDIYVFFLLTIFFSSISFIAIERPLSKIRYKSNNFKKEDISI